VAVQRLCDVREPRRHRLIWAAVGCVHLAAIAGVVASGAWLAGGTEAPEGGLILIRLDAEPLGSSGEVPQGLGLGGAQGFLPDASLVLRSSVPTASEALAGPAVAVAAPAVSSPSSLAAVSRPALAPAFLPPQFRVRVEPTYPERARRAGVEGRVTVRLRISAAGEVLSADLAASSGSASLDAAALSAAQASRFTPAQAEAGAVPSDATATYRFELK